MLLRLNIVHVHPLLPWLARPSYLNHFEFNAAGTCWLTGQIGLGHAVARDVATRTTNALITVTP